MYECPIMTYIDEAVNAINQEMVERENAITLKISEIIGVDVNREELIKALNYDRQQYEKGYADAKVEYAPKWTKVEDGLPDLYEDNNNPYTARSEEVLCKALDLDTKEVLNTCGYRAKYLNTTEWYTDCMGVEVIAWMPIPKYEG